MSLVCLWVRLSTIDRITHLQVLGPRALSIATTLTSLNPPLSLSRHPSPLRVHHPSTSLRSPFISFTLQLVVYVSRSQDLISHIIRILMNHFPRSRDPLHQPTMQSITFAPPNQPPPDGSRFLVDSTHDSDKTETNIAFMKGPKRKRLAKVCTPTTPFDVRTRTKHPLGMRRLPQK